MRFRAALLSISLAVSAPLAAAQTTRGRPPQQSQPQPQQSPSTGTEAWYRAQLVELAQVLGGAHYLRIECFGRRDQRWRDYMRGVMSREPRYEALLVENFNRGYREEEARFPECDRTAEQGEAELRARGLRIANGLSARSAERRTQAPEH